MHEIVTHAVLIAGGGPTGLMLAGELALAGVDAAIVERRPNQHLLGSRGSGMHARTIEVLDQRGIADRFLAEGQTHPAVHFHIPLSLADFPSRHNYALGLWQNHTERILAGWVAELGVTIYFERDVMGFTQDDSGVDVAISGGRTVRARYLVGCDGGRSLIRKTAGIEFPGWDATTSWLNAEVEMTGEPKWGFHEDTAGIHAIGKGDGGIPRVVLEEAHVQAGDEPSLQELRETLLSIYGTDFGVHNPRWISRFTDMTRQAARYRDGRVLLAGDAAHVHPPLGGQGLNLGVQDAVNLGWKLAQVINGTSPDALLDTYHDERHPVAARALRSTMAQMAIRRRDERSKALAETLTELLAMDEPRRRVAGQVSGLDITYDVGEGHPLLGRRMPDLDLVTADGPRRVFTLLHDARPVLLNLGAPGAMSLDGWSDRVRIVDATYDGAWELPVIGSVDPVKAVLIRPDGYVAWTGDAAAEGLTAAVTRWFGPSR